MRLTELPLRQPAYVDVIDWDALSAAEGQRLREFGLCEGVTIEALHHGGLLRKGPIACKVGRMIIAMRRSHAAAVTVRSNEQQGAQDASATGGAA